MSELIKPYELSVWEDVLVKETIEEEGEEKEISYFKERKIADIGSSTMTSRGKAYDVVLRKNKNGEKTLSFSIKSKYYDPDTEQMVENPFVSFLINERKVKLHYENEWHDFIIKEQTESTEEFEWHYECQDAFVLELSKTGYNLEFSSDLGNNQGSALELAFETLKNTDWQVAALDIEPSKINEPVYYADLLYGDGIPELTIRDMNTNEEVEIEEDTPIFVFYSYISNKSGKLVQFILQSTTYDVDSNNNITATNYVIDDELELKEDGFYKDNIKVIDLGALYLEHQVYRVVLKQLSTYDTIMERTVDRYDANGTEVRRYSDYIYTSSDIVVSYITNGSNFNVYDGERVDRLQGWSNNTGIDNNPELNLTTFPDDMREDLIPLEALRQAEGYIEAKFTMAQNPLNLGNKGYLFNSGIEDNASMVGHISQGEEFLLRWRAARASTGEQVNYATLLDGSGLTIKNVDNDEIISISNANIFIFSDSIDNNDGQEIQFIIQRPIEEYDVDSNNNIIDTNYLIEDTLEYKEDGFYKDEIKIIEWGDILENYKVCRTLGTSNRILEELNPKSFGAVVGFYTKETDEATGMSYNQLDTSDILFNFYFDGPLEAEVPKLNNRLTTGYFTSEDPELLPNKKSFYVIDGVVQEPSTRYIYQQGKNNTEYVWDVDNKEYVSLASYSEFFNYYYLTAAAERGITSEEITDPTTKIGIFFYIRDGEEISEHYYYFQDIQLTRYYKDALGNPVILGEAPLAQSTAIDYYYVAPDSNATKDSVITYASLEAIAEALGLSPEEIKPIYTNDDLVFIDREGEPVYVLRTERRNLMDLFYVKGYVLSKILSIDASKSNCFNILQTIAETFECWLEIEVFHDEDGAITIDEEGKPLKYIYLRQYAGKDNFAGFKYGINLQSIERTIDSNEIVTKLIVDQSQSDLVDSGVVSIQKAASNLSGESYILNFDYFCNQNLLDREEVEKDYLELFEDLKQINDNLNTLEQKKANLSNSLDKISANRNVYITLLDTAKDRLTDALEDFKRQTGYEYADYQGLPQEEKDKITALFEVDTFMNTLGEIYSNAIVVNNYEGLCGANEEEYNDIKEELYGMSDGSITVSRVYDSAIDKDYVRIVLNDYIVPFSFNIEGETYSTSVNQKSFNIPVDPNHAAEITDFTYSDKYSGIFDTDGIQITIVVPVIDTVQKFTLKAAAPTASLQDRINTIIEEKKKRIALFENKYSNFILEGNWSSTDYIDDELYYLDALNLSRVSAFPKITYDINVVDIGGLEEYREYAFNAGDKTFIEDTEFFGWIEVDGMLTPVQEEVIVAEVEWHLDDPSNNSITVQNYKTNFEDLFQRIQATVQTVQYNEITYPKTNAFVEADGTLNESVLLKSLNKISGKPFTLTSDGSVYIKDGTIVVKNLTNTANCVRINSEGIQITSDGGITWSTAVGGQGINIGKVFTGSINTKEVAIGNPDNASFYWDSNGLNAYKLTDTDAYDRNTYVRFDEFGLYGIVGDDKLKLHSISEVEEKAHFGITWNGFFIKSEHPEAGGGKVKISKTEDIQVIDGQDKERVKIGYLGKDSMGNNLYGLRLRNANGEDALTTDSEGNITLMGTLQSDNYEPSGGLAGWKIDRAGDATFNNVSVRGAIKTAVFEYSEIQAVGGAFLFRPSSTITAAEIVDAADIPAGAPSTVNFKVQVENFGLFKLNDWCKISNYFDEGAISPTIEGSGLVYVYPIDYRDTENRWLYFTVSDESFFEKIVNIVGGSLISMGNYSGGITSDNYGIGINSSDDYINLRPRAISLFETEIQPNESVKVNYNMRGILGTLPPGMVDNTIYNNMQNTQGIYTNNMYIGDADQYVAFYRDRNDANRAKLDIKGTLHIGDSTLDSIINIENGGISLGNPNYFHIFIDGDSSHFNTYGLGFYEDSHNIIEYILTEDNAVIQGKDYYTKNGSAYEKVDNPTGNPSAQGWYEIKDRRIAYINDQRLHIPYTVVLKGMDLGDKWRWELQPDTDNLTLKWMGGEE